MTVKEDKSFKVQKDGQVHYFCSAHYKERFLSTASATENLKQSSFAKLIYTCPMHPEIHQDHPEDCPKCGMCLEPLNPAGEENEDQQETRSLSLKFWIDLAVATPLIFLVVIEIGLKIFDQRVNSL
jgi:Cu+-exporting ATPase